MEKHPKPLSFVLTLIAMFSQPVSSVDFVFNGFNSTDVLLCGHASINSRILTLADETSSVASRAFYRSKIPTKIPDSSRVLPFSTSFIFSAPPSKYSSNVAFFFTPNTDTRGTNSDLHIHFSYRVVIYSNNLVSGSYSHTAGYWLTGDFGDRNFEELNLNNGENYQLWIDYADSVLNVTMAPIGIRRPKRPLLNVSFNLSDVFEDEMYVGFISPPTGGRSPRILAWSFSNSNFGLSESLITVGLPSFNIHEVPFYRHRSFPAGATVAILFVLVLAAMFYMCLIKRERRKAREKAAMEDWEFEYWPHKMTYQEIDAATNGLSDENVIGFGGNGKVYKGVLRGGTEIAVKRISHESNGRREFLAEISSLGRLKHRHLVGLKGWCKKQGAFMLIYDYMENGSLDKRVYYDFDESKMLSCDDRIRILKDVASAILYLHEGWEAKVLHRDIKASNVLLDKYMNGRLGDFGLARMDGQGQVANTTHMVGTVGYLAPEVLIGRRTSTRTDVFSFGILILEVMCGRRPVEEGKPALVEWVWQLKKKHELLAAVDARLTSNRGFDEEEVENVLHLGLWCSCPSPDSRPTMRQVVKVLEGKNEHYELETRPTIDSIQQLHLCSMSFSWANSSVEGWVKPPTGWFCLNTDGAVSSVTGSSSIGGAIRVSSGDWLPGGENVEYRRCWPSPYPAGPSDHQALLTFLGGSFSMGFSSPKQGCGSVAKLALKDHFDLVQHAFPPPVARPLLTRDITPTTLDYGNPV
ncbi:L-type lectin-domain containing receptor kinase VII.1 [Hibiscus syriacus]|uniref:non-specific serine/threonine protein kinase n=1 Tax=Hibiscus syriacus TaxID=106335 RepID=A0A6A3AMT6_HIBSY|nr:L-type lectin-domain containing receptor kinase VII.1-like [Hibiscus syriacus]KAE8705924.1 L-type lectin-domain containing receptor kinase VII.1 [Hibiscus syriacus]